MDDIEIFSGRLGQHESPEWAPLRKFLPLVLAEGFMWMNDIRLDSGGRLQAYKHSDTRAYLYLDDDPLPYEALRDGKFRRMRRHDAIEQVFRTGWVLGFAEDDEAAALRETLHTAAEADLNESRAGAQIPPSSPAAALRFMP